LLILIVITYRYTLLQDRGPGVALCNSRPLGYPSKKYRRAHHCLKETFS
jgi:hypothetical protein